MTNSVDLFLDLIIEVFYAIENDTLKHLVLAIEDFEAEIGMNFPDGGRNEQKTSAF